MNLTCYVVDDEFHAIEVLTDFIGKTPGLTLCGSALNPLIALQEISGFPAPDLIFLDVDMPEINGLDFADLIDGPSKIIFTTSFREFAADAFDKAAADFLLKPIGYPRFLKCIQKIRRESVSQAAPDAAGQSFFVKSDTKGKLVRILTSSILYIESLQHYIHIHFSTHTVITYLPISEIAERLPGHQFSRIHKSFVVNHDYIQALEQNQVRVTDKTLLPIGRSYRAGFLQKLQVAQNNQVNDQED